MLNPFSQLFQHCWGHARSSRMVYKDLWVVPFPRCTAGPNIVWSCCIHLQTTANKHTATPNIVGATMLGVVASVCTQPKKRANQADVVQMIDTCTRYVRNHGQGLIENNTNSSSMGRTGHHHHNITYSNGREGRTRSMRRG